MHGSTEMRRKIKPVSGPAFLNPHRCKKNNTQLMQFSESLSSGTAMTSRFQHRSLPALGKSSHKHCRFKGQGFKIEKLNLQTGIEK